MQKHLIQHYSQFYLYLLMNESKQLQISEQLPDSTALTMRHPNQKSNPQYFALDEVSLRQLRERNRQTENAIKAVKSRINYMKTKQEKTVRKVLNVRRKLNSLDEVRHKNKQYKQQSIQEKKRGEESLQKKAQFNKLIKDHLKFNKKIVMTLLNHKIHEEVKVFKDKKQQNSMLYQLQKDNMTEDNVEKANKVRSDHIEAHQKRKMYFLEKLKQFKDFKERKLQQEIRERERQQSLILEMEQKQKVLLQRLSVSQKFRMKCQQEYEDAKRKYQSFYEATRSRGVSRDSKDNSVTESKAQIFIS